MKEMALVYLLGGLSQRFGGGIKPLACIGKNDEPMLEVSLQQAFSAGFTKIVFIVSPLTYKSYLE
ncbi:MAG: nucleotidyltransferase, partial [Nanoarchaeota archaeon]